MDSGHGLTTLILAAGLGKRMKSNLPKVLHPLAGRPLVAYVVDLAEEIGSERVILVVGHGREKVIEALRGRNVEWAVQKQQLGTGDAVRACVPLLQGYSGDLLILSGDVPLLRHHTVMSALAVHGETGSAGTVFTFIPDDPAGYGRIRRGAGSSLTEIVEQKDASAMDLAIREVNAGVYLFSSRKLLPALELLSNDNAASEFYLTDCIGILGRQGERLSAFMVSDPLEMAGVNDPDQLRRLEREYLRRKAEVVDIDR